MKPNSRLLPFYSILVIFVSCLLVTDALSQLTWVRDTNNPVLKRNSGEFGDPNGFSDLWTIGVYADSAASTYKMWFGSRSITGGSSYGISYAVSPNQKDWYFYSQNPVLMPGPDGSFDDAWVLDPNVIFDGTEFKMYYSAYDGTLFSIGLATSPDGIHWTKLGPVLSAAAGTWESIAASQAEAYFDGTTYHMVYHGYNGAIYSIGAATSSDGIHWDKHPLNPVLTRGAVGSWDQLQALAFAMTVHEGQYYLLYQGAAFGDVGLATSTDGISWTKYAGNPVFSAGNPGAFDAGIGFGSVIVNGGSLELWYSGINGASQVGHATSPFVGLQVADGQKPLTYALDQNFPNPFNPSTTIRYQIEHRSAVELRVYNALGELVATLIDGVRDPGAQEVRWDAANMPTGIYFCRIIVTDLGNPNSAYTSVTKMVLVR